MLTQAAMLVVFVRSEKINYGFLKTAAKIAKLFEQARVGLKVPQ